MKTRWVDGRNWSDVVTSCLINPFARVVDVAVVVDNLHCWHFLSSETLFSTSNICSEEMRWWTKQPSGQKRTHLCWFCKTRKKSCEGKSASRKTSMSHTFLVGLEKSCIYTICKRSNRQHMLELKYVVMWSSRINATNTANYRFSAPKNTVYIKCGSSILSPNTLTTDPEFISQSPNCSN